MFFSTHEEVTCNGHNFQIKLELIALFLQLRSLRILKTSEIFFYYHIKGIYISEKSF